MDKPYTTEEKYEMHKLRVENAMLHKEIEKLNEALIETTLYKEFTILRILENHECDCGDSLPTVARNSIRRLLSLPQLVADDKGQLHESTNT